MWKNNYRGTNKSFTSVVNNTKFFPKEAIKNARQDFVKSSKVNGFKSYVFWTDFFTLLSVLFWSVAIFSTIGIAYVLIYGVVSPKPLQKISIFFIAVSSTSFGLAPVFGLLSVYFLHRRNFYIRHKVDPFPVLQQIIEASYDNVKVLEKTSLKTIDELKLASLINFGPNIKLARVYAHYDLLINGHKATFFRLSWYPINATPYQDDQFYSKLKEGIAIVANDFNPTFQDLEFQMTPRKKADDFKFEELTFDERYEINTNDTKLLDNLLTPRVKQMFVNQTNNSKLCQTTSFIKTASQYFLFAEVPLLKHPIDLTWSHRHPKQRASYLPIGDFSDLYVNNVAHLAEQLMQNVEFLTIFEELFY